MHGKRRGRMSRGTSTWQRTDGPDARNICTAESLLECFSQAEYQAPSERLPLRHVFVPPSGHTLSKDAFRTGGSHDRPSTLALWKLSRLANFVAKIGLQGSSREKE